MSTTHKTRIEREYATHMPALVKFAKGVVGDEAEDVAHDAFLEVIGLPDLPDAEIGGLLMQRLKWRINDFLRRREAVLEVDLGEVEDDSDDLQPMRLEDLEATQLHHGSTPAWPTAVNHDSPEELVSADQLRTRLREAILAECSDAEYAMFLAVVVDDIRQARVAKEFNVDQASVSRAVAHVRGVVESYTTDREPPVT